MKQHINPFQVLYVTDSPDPKTFVSLFSEKPINVALPLFNEGNIVLKGTQGAGKSMLLNLLQPNIRLAYYKAEEEFPVPGKYRKFISAGINLTLSGALDIGQRPLSSDLRHDEELFPLLFADFMNYYLIRDLLINLGVLADNQDVFDNIVVKKRLDLFADKLAKQQCWFGYLNGIHTFDNLLKKIECRLAAYRSFHQFNSDLSVEIQKSKTQISEPLAIAHDVLKQTAVVSEDVPLLVRIDQLERLHRSDIVRPNLGREYRRVVNKAIGRRDSRVSYKIGTRSYAWEEGLEIYRTKDNLELDRDYRVVSLEMRRKEDRKTWMFPDFAKDAFVRRLEHAGYNLDGIEDPLTHVFGNALTPEEMSKKYVKKSSASKILKLDDSWSELWKEKLNGLFNQSPFTALLASAWASQKGNSKRDRKCDPPPDDAPWEKTYWKKERVRQCLMQIAARNQQKMRWSGGDSILAISAPNISVFLSVCHEIWDAFIRSEERKDDKEKTNPVVNGIGDDIQAIGIQTASKAWYEKIAEQPHGHDRQRFIDKLGSFFRKKLLDDFSMSYPGHVGFSVEVEGLREHPEINQFLKDASDYGDLHDTDHTTRTKNRKKRKKWYINPILSPYYQIPEAHPKEPLYIDAPKVLAWLVEAGVEIEGAHNVINPASPSDEKTEKDRTLYLNFESEEMGGE